MGVSKTRKCQILTFKVNFFMSKLIRIFLKKFSSKLQVPPYNAGLAIHSKQSSSQGCRSQGGEGGRGVACVPQFWADQLTLS